MPAPKKMTFTLARLRALETGDGEITVWDTQQPGLAVRVSRAKDGSPMRRLFAQLRVGGRGGRQRKATICDVSEIHSVKALEKIREDVSEWRRLAKRGVDPIAATQAEKEAAAADAAARETAEMTVAGFAEVFLEECAATEHKDGGARAKLSIRRLVDALGSKPVAAVTLADMKALQSRMAKEITPSAVNRSFSDISKMFTFAKERGAISERPTAGMSAFRETPREAVLDLDDMKAFWRALDRVESARWKDRGTPVEVRVDAIRLLCLTGARRGEVLSARLDEFDLTPGKARWSRPALRMKAGVASDIPISDPAAQIVRRALERQEREPWARGGFVFPVERRGPATTHISSVRDPFLAAKEEAGLSARDFRLHDIRATFASTLVWHAGLPPELAATLTAHNAAPAGNILVRSYLRMQDEPRLRAALDVVAEAWGAGAVEPSRWPGQQDAGK